MAIPWGRAGGQHIALNANIQGQFALAFTPGAAAAGQAHLALNQGLSHGKIGSALGKGKRQFLPNRVRYPKLAAAIVPEENGDWDFKRQAQRASTGAQGV